ncbi:MAG: hypothetical protein HOM21_16780, partial [Halobacteriovoraceae bacterium]|nr:hypothetical protein [Halobacteriovoraceae bacterium]
PQNIEKRYDPPLSGAKKIYFGAHFLVILLLTITFLMKEAALSGLDRIFLTLALSYLLFVLGHYLDDQKIWPLEGLRLGILGLVFYLLI